MQTRLLATGALAVALACAGGPPDAPPPGKAVVWGYVTLVPPKGADSGGGNAYGDRRLRDAHRVDYSRPGFAVVYVVGGEAGPVRAHAQRAGEAREIELAVEDGAVGPRLAPRHVALRQGDRVLAHNRTDAPQSLASPSLGVVRRIAPGETVVFGLPRAGEHAVYLLGSTDVAATLFVVPGPYATVSSTGRYVLDDLEPGAIELRSWHPRLPPSRQQIAVVAGEVARHDLEIGVGLDTKTKDDEEYDRASN